MPIDFVPPFPHRLTEVPSPWQRFLSLPFAQLRDRHRTGLEVAVNTSFNVAGPIAQTVPQTIDTLRRSKGLDAVLIFAEEGSVFAVWHCDRPAAGASRFLQWFELWRAETGASAG